MNLSRFIQTEMEKLLENWEDAALQIAPELKGEDSNALRDHAREMLEFVAQDILKPQTTHETARKAIGKAEAHTTAAGKHGVGRMEMGVSLQQVVQELRALRAAVTGLWGSEQRGLTTRDIDELVRFNEAIDQLITISVQSYSDRKERETRLLEAMQEVSPDPSAIFAPDGRLLFLNNAMADLVGTPAQDIKDKTPRELGLGFATELSEIISAAVTTGNRQCRELYCRLPSGRKRYFECQIAPVYDDRHQIEAIAKISRDITERKLVEQQIWRSANLDALTGIPNRRLFLDRLEQSLLEAERKGSTLALLFIDLDLFKQANDRLGHKTGDRLLAQVGERISANVRAMDTVARLGGDEFTVILKDTCKKDALRAAKGLLASLEQAFDIDSHRVHISGSIGLTMFPEDGFGVEQLLHNADQAMYAAKQRGGHQFQHYQPSMTRSESEHMRLNRELNDAFYANQLEVYYQPIIDIRTGAICRAEALLRWNHPDRGLLGPAAFLHIAEQSGMADSINNYVLEQAVTCSIRWGSDNKDPFPININESPSSFFTRTLVEQWRTRLTESNLGKGQITMELSPGSLASVRASGFNPVKSFKLEGLRLRLAIGDFGIEPFSLVALHVFGVNSIKVDKELVKNVGSDSEADRILEAIITMAHALNIEVVAEGVEKEEQLHFLECAGCDYAQGYLFSTPLPQDAFEQLLRQEGP
ncbi:putative bifunctional diguanylate cyclase/phosphodiesterase [Marinobacter salicampi]|uniref:putative bifunctional diguanylate cyclase/phosphodiesterase n=1 Tax=Marinobacter salicampi TaxID=435907 RepID=UPI00140A0A6E|nr:EAL domain-containing protein [Marinobacter salicampi]